MRPAKQCSTCGKACYPTEGVRISDFTVHKHCLKCSVCFSTLSLTSVYVSPSPLPPHDKLLFCASDVPKKIHTSIVDSATLRQVQVLQTSRPGEAGAGALDAKRSLRFKGLTLRSKAIRAGLNAPKLDVVSGYNRGLVVGHNGSGLDSWDIMHAMSVQARVSAPLRDHPAIHAQYTGIAGAQQLHPQYTGRSSASAKSYITSAAPLSAQPTGASTSTYYTAKGTISRAERGVRGGVDIAPDLVKNLIKVFQLDTVSQVDLPVDQSHSHSRTSNLEKTASMISATSETDVEGELDAFSDTSSSHTERGGSGSASTAETEAETEDEPVSSKFKGYEDTLSRGFQSSNALSSEFRCDSAPSTTGTGPGTMRGWEKEWKATFAKRGGTITTLGTRIRTGSRRGLQANQSSLGAGGGVYKRARIALCDMFTAPAPAPPEDRDRDRDQIPPESGTAVAVVPSLGGDMRKAMELLNHLLPLAAHLIPLPGADEDEPRALDSGSKAVDMARDDLARDLESSGLEIVMLFEELPEHIYYSDE